MKKATIGIDPGLSGGVAIITDNEFYVFDMPAIEVTKTKKEYDIRRLNILLQDAIEEYDEIEVFIEKVHSMPKQGVASSFNFGMGYGLIIGIVSALKLPYTLVLPTAWKKTMMAGMKKDKGESVIRANQLYPDAELTTNRGRKLDGRADALLIGHYGKYNGITE